MKTLYLDTFSGISGDMFLGAMIHLGLDLGHLERELSKLGLTGYHLHAERRQNSNIEGIKFDVHLEAEHHHHESEHGHSTSHAGHSHPHDDDHGQGHTHDGEGHAHSYPHQRTGHHEHPTPTHAASRDFKQIRHMIESSALSPWVKDKAVAVFQRVAVAEGKIHGRPPENVHFHEVGAIDSIVDIVGACIALEVLGKPRVLAAPVVDGTGWVDCAHGRFPIPTAATLEILSARGIAITQCEEPNELVTPTGAALLAEFAESFGPMQNLVSRQIGYGLGTRQNKTRPNVLRAILAEPAIAAGPGSGGGRPDARDWEIDTVTVLETNLDDCHPEILGHFLELALAAGALDLFYSPVQMKKNRPGVLLTLLCAPEDAERFSEMLLRETSAFGVRRHSAERRKLRRESVTVQTTYGKVSLKLGKLDGQIVHATPEFESCKKLASEANASLGAVYQAAEEASRELRSR
jgi:hypothetical protein